MLNIQFGRCGETSYGNMKQMLVTCRANFQGNINIALEILNDIFCGITVMSGYVAGCIAGICKNIILENGKQVADKKFYL